MTGRRTVQRPTRTTPPQQFYTTTLANERNTSLFYPEFKIIKTTIDSVNSFNVLYRDARVGAGGPATHQQQDLYRAMLVFACAGLDVFAKQIIKTKLPNILSRNENAKNAFKEFIRRGINKDETKLLSILALALTEQNPKDVLLDEYIKSLTAGSLQSLEELNKVVGALALDEAIIFEGGVKNSLKDAFIVRNQIIHEMDINIASGGPRTTGYRNRRQRTETLIEGHTTTVLAFAERLFVACKAQ